MSRGEIRVDNFGSMNGVSVGGQQNVSLSSSAPLGDLSPLVVELRRVEEQLRLLPLAEEARADQAAVTEALRLAESGQETRALSVLSTVGAWVAAVAASVSAMLIKDQITG